MAWGRKKKNKPSLQRNWLLSMVRKIHKRKILSTIYLPLQEKTRTKCPNKTKVILTETYVYVQADMSEIFHASDNFQEVPEMQEFLDDKQSEVCN
jgi:hypothetical protein